MRTVGTQRVVGVDEEREILSIQIRFRDQLYLVLILLSQLAIISQQFILIARINARHEVKLAFDELQKCHLLVDEETDGNGINVRQSLPCLVTLEIVGIHAKYEFHILFPVLELERPRADWMATEVIAIILDGFVWHHRGVGHGKDAQERWKRLRQLDLESRVIQSRESILVVHLFDG